MTSQKTTARCGVVLCLLLLVLLAIGTVMLLLIIKHADGLYFDFFFITKEVDVGGRIFVRKIHITLND